MKKMILAIASLSLLASGVQAADMSNTDGVYLGVASNSIRIKAQNDSTQNQLGFYAGYRFGNLAAEISHSERKIDDQKTSFTDLSFVPHVAIAKNVDIIGKLGLRSSSISEAGMSDSGRSLVIGVGAEYAFLPQWNARLMVDRSSKTFGLKTSEGEQIKATTTTLGVAYKF